MAGLDEPLANLRLFEDYPLYTDFPQPNSKSISNHQLVPVATSLNQQNQAFLSYKDIRVWQTRIVTIEPGAPGQPIPATLEVVDLIHNSGVVIHQSQQPCQYEALSYCWGKANFLWSVTLNSVLDPITQELT